MSAEFVDPVAALAARDTKREQTRSALAVIDKHPEEAARRIASVAGVTVQPIARYGWTLDEVCDLKSAIELDIVDADSYAHAWTILKRIRGTRKALTAWYEGLKKPLNQLRAAALDLQGFDETAAEGIDKGLSVKIDTWDSLQREREAAEQRRLQDEADRLAQEEQRQAAAALAASADAHPDPVIGDALLRESEAIAAAPVVAERVLAPSFRPAIHGGGFRTGQWKGTVTNKLAFLKAVASGKIPLDAVEIKESWLNDQARALKQNMSRVYPGTEAIAPGRTTAVRG